MAKVVSAGQKWARLEKEYLHTDWTSDTESWIAGGRGGGLSARKRIFNILIFDHVKNCLKMEVSVVTFL